MARVIHSFRSLDLFTRLPGQVGKAHRLALDTKKPMSLDAEDRPQ
jgi:hypothetical protein